MEDFSFDQWAVVEHYTTGSSWDGTRKTWYHAVLCRTFRNNGQNGVPCKSKEEAEALASKMNED